MFNKVNEDKYISYDIEKVRKEIIKRYSLADWQFQIVEEANKINVALVVPNYIRNEELITKDMDIFGYYVNLKYKKELFGYPHLIIKFDPKYPPSINNTVRNLTCLLHLTPIYNLESIEKNGFIPQHKNKKFSYPPRLHFIKGNVTRDDVILLGQQLCNFNDDIKNNGEYIRC